MNELIKVTYGDNDAPTVSGRELHAFLEVGTDYRHWFPRMCEYGFTEGIDYEKVKNDRVIENPVRGQHGTLIETDHALTIDMAKEICMIQRNEKGKIAREYFLAIEKAWNTPEQVMARGLLAAQRMIEQRNVKIAELEAARAEDRPKVVFADAVSVSNESILIGELAKILKGNGIAIGQNRLFERLRRDGYLIKRRGTDYNAPTQRAMELGLFRVKETAITHSDGHVTISKTTKVTGKGQQYFINLFLAERGDGHDE
ncbi:MAG: phage antirepressor KilAC domain-containing protein [Oscillospiraceae bacterium]|jgi:anti-repressor protein|nr:phage antirepressor KilAC domain-containing protein [Oscillospiraceae bacterium]